MTHVMQSKNKNYNDSFLHSSHHPHKRTWLLSDADDERATSSASDSVLPNPNLKSIVKHSKIDEYGKRSEHSQERLEQERGKF